MTVSKEYNKHVYAGNGLTTAWPYDFDLPLTAGGDPDTSLIHVYRTDLRGTVTEVTTGFTIDADTGTLTYPTSGTPLEDGEKLTVMRTLPIRQQFFDPSNQANLYPETLEDNTDRLVMMLQQLQEETDRALKVGVGTDPAEGGLTAEELLAHLTAARNIAVDAAALAEGYAGSLPAIADELDVNIVVDEADLRAKLAAIGASNASLVIATTIPIAEDLTIPSNVALSFKKTGQLQPASGKTLTINGPIDSGIWQIFGGEGTTTIGGTSFPRYPQWFGAIGDGVADDTGPLQKALDCGGTILLPRGRYLVSKKTGVNDAWGIKITQSNTVLKGENGAELKRYSTDISTYAQAYTVLFIGVPDDDDAAATENVTVENVTFIGEDTLHGIQGGYMPDKRTAITVRNTRGTVIRNCTLTNMDSNGIEFMWPGTYNYAGGAYYNRTKNYDGVVTGSRIISTPHEVVGRAQNTAIILAGVDRCTISGNHIEWCDVGIAGEGQYDRPSDAETDLYDSGPTKNMGDLMRAGRNWVVTGNTFYNITERAIYAAATDIIFADNTIFTDRSDLALGAPIKIRSRNVSITGNTVAGNRTGIEIAEPSYNCVVANNVLHVTGVSNGGAIDIISVGLDTFLANRAWLASGAVMHNISITGNLIEFPETPADANNAIAFRVTSDYGGGDTQIDGLSIFGNIVRNYRHGLDVYSYRFRNFTVRGNTFIAKPFTVSGFSSGTTMGTLSLMRLHGSYRYAFENMVFAGNYIHGCVTLFSTTDGTGENIYLPTGMIGNTFNYIKAFKTAQFLTPQLDSTFRDNVGMYFLDRTGWVGPVSLNNALNNGTNSDSAKKYTMRYTGTAVQFVTDDANTAITLG